MILIFLFGLCPPININPDQPFCYFLLLGLENLRSLLFCQMFLYVTKNRETELCFGALGN